MAALSDHRRPYASTRTGATGARLANAVPENRRASLSFGRRSSGRWLITEGGDHADSDVAELDVAVLADGARHLERTSAVHRRFVSTIARAWPIVARETSELQVLGYLGALGDAHRRAQRL